ncbi:MAG: transposase [Pseudanabaena sp.]
MRSRIINASRVQEARIQTRNSRNGYSQKKVQGDFGIAEIAIPRDRNGEFEPHLVKKGQSRLSGIDEKIIALYARGMSVRDIQSQLQEMYGVEVSPTLISNVTDEVIDLTFPVIFLFQRNRQYAYRHNPYSSVAYCH